MPMAFKNSGLLVGALGTLIVGLICTHCVHILVSVFEKLTDKTGNEKFKSKLIAFVSQVRTSHGVCRKAKIPALGFAETAEKVFENGPIGVRKYANFAR